ncbi:hypothetical protein AB840_00910 [Megasphaera cerevisiae DSM 20462]|jgi:uncharacterized protein (TIGR03905 family)|uniref:ribonucleoside-diphosphate reductase n=1 Tax=Megasphaera cerevisiae DSM 20462 TaxID=1122219 RepID=A0A0J6X0N9_9FIRM|nr:TIGR03905 family TSCPD domain-containing protein [Megasphaera cerevisiae]KMO87722.1 hypothetical protein AB840_00910 [Megasphaera cerevisiae DSM 20462]OKY53352.1 TIGR03905 family protein [Megasphaera cerevisiae]SJZ64452.1 uncharacterized protein TIGR03905 [Megasphaera cerevisiae DSM 20462]
MYTYKPEGVCSKQINFDIDGGVIKNVSFVGGCSGNLQGISRLVEGMKVADAIDRLTGICCGAKDTSCPDQFAHALRKTASIIGG